MFFYEMCKNHRLANSIVLRRQWEPRRMSHVCRFVRRPPCREKTPERGLFVTDQRPLSVRPGRPDTAATHTCVRTLDAERS